MAAIDNIVQVQVTAASTAVASQNFAIPLIIGTTKASGATPTVISCTQPSDLTSAGYSTSSVEYTYAQALCSQAVRPPTFKVATRTASGAIAADIAAISAVDDSWYGCCIAGLSDADVQAAATAIEGLFKIYIAVSATPAIAQSGTSDLASQLASASLTRTALIWSPGSATAGIDAAWLGGQLPKRPGSATWAFKSLTGIPADAITPSQANALIGVPVGGTAGKNANIYQTVGGVAVTQMGTMAGGGFIDARIGQDSLQSTIKTNVYSVLVNNAKIPYTDQGATLFESAVRAAIDQHVDFGFLSGSDPITVSHTPVAQVPVNQRAQRVGPPIQFSCRTSGAQHAVTIVGNVNV